MVAQVRRGVLDLKNDTAGALENVISRAGEEIHSQYLLSFVPAKSAKDGFHQIQVAVPSRPDAVIRVRQGYWPNK